MIADKTIKDAYYPIELPQRATKGSAGYDFYSPLSFWCIYWSLVVLFIICISWKLLVW